MYNTKVLTPLIYYRNSLTSLRKKKKRKKEKSISLMYTKYIEITYVLCNVLIYVFKK